jgi:hypothetical protein
MAQQRLAQLLRPPGIEDMFPPVLPGQLRGITTTIGRPGEHASIVAMSFGAGMAAILEDPRVVISVALQYGISARALAKSTARLPTAPLALPYLDHPLGALSAASIIGAALDLISDYEASRMGDIRTTEPLVLTVRPRETNAAAVLTGGAAFNARFNSADRLGSKTGGPF